MREFFAQFPTVYPVGWTLLVIACIATLGLWIRQIRWKGLGLGSAGVLFAGIFLGHLGVEIDSGWMGLIREFGLILFVYTIGIQVGPGFIDSLKKQGLSLNLMAAAIAILGAILAVIVGRLADFEIMLTAGIFSGASTNTPALGAIQEAMANFPNLSIAQKNLPALGYAVAYPFGIFGILLTMILIRTIFKINVPEETARLEKMAGGSEKLERRNVLVTNASLSGRTIRTIPAISETGVVVSRIRAKTEEGAHRAVANTEIHVGDILLAVGSKKGLEDFTCVVGELSDQDLLKAEGALSSQRVIVTSPAVYGKSLRTLALSERHGVTITRLTRAGLEIPARADIKLQFGDQLILVGEKGNVLSASSALGNSVRQLSHTNFIPVFIGIGLGILLGTVPLHFPSIPSPVRFGLAGGPLLVAILLSHLGRVGRVIWYMPSSANLALRELGVILFLSCVGLKAGGHFVQTLMHGSGLRWMFAGMVITFVPLFLAGLFARIVLKYPFANICGLLAGSMTDPPALAFANSIIGSETPSVSYATVYPLTMLMRIVLAQIIVLLFAT